MINRQWPVLLDLENRFPCVGKDPQVQILTFEHSSGASTRELALQNLALDSTDDQVANDGGDDLLDLLDSVA